MQTKNKNILVVGGAGYIGSHMVDHLLTHHYNPIVLDNLSTGHAKSVEKKHLIIGDIADQCILDTIFSQHAIFAVMHFASYIQAGESILTPAKYYQNNVSHFLNLLQCMLKWKVNKIIFSSTAAVYGQPLYTPIDENHILNPINPYGQSKKIAEQILQDFSAAYGLQFTIFRYFNAASRKPRSHLYEKHNPETHLIPSILETARNKKHSIKIFGTDYNTQDGTCIRDYLHVLDICEAHGLALAKMYDDQHNACYNLGTGCGYSVKQVIEAARKIIKRDIPMTECGRRAGDPAILIADANLAKTYLAWSPRRSDIETIIADAYF